MTDLQVAILNLAVTLFYEAQYRAKLADDSVAWQSWETAAADARAMYMEQARNAVEQRGVGDVTCGCRNCQTTYRPMETYFVVCGCCGNKRCPAATFHGFACTESNEPSQVWVLA